MGGVHRVFNIKKLRVSLLVVTNCIVLHRNNDTHAHMLGSHVTVLILKCHNKLRGYPEEIGHGICRKTRMLLFFYVISLVDR